MSGVEECVDLFLREVIDWGGVRFDVGFRHTADGTLIGVGVEGMLTGRVSGDEDIRGMALVTSESLIADEIAGSSAGMGFVFDVVMGFGASRISAATGDHNGRHTKHEERDHSNHELEELSG